MIQYTDLLKNFELFKDEYESELIRVIRSGWYVLGPELEKFENEFADYLKVKYCIGVNSGTDALILAVRALGIGSMNSDFGGSSNDEVIVPAGTYIASVLGITENGAKPVYVDSNPETLLINPDLIENAITEHTKAILPVHLYGQACNMDKIVSIAEKYNISIIEDCAQCHGARWNGNMCGTKGTISAFSFYPTKPLGAFGDAGALVTNDDKIASRIYMLRNYGSKIKYINETIGRNSRLDEIQASLLSVGLRHLDEMNDMRIGISEEYFTNISNPKVRLPYTDPMATNVFHLFPVIVDNQKRFQNHMLENGIKTQIHYPIPPYVAECYKNQMHNWAEFPNASYIAQHEVSLPIYSGMPDSDVENVINAVNRY